MVSRWRFNKFKFRRYEFFTKILGYYSSPYFTRNRSFHTFACRIAKTNERKFARAKGVNEFKVIVKHALRNAVNPLITLLGFEFAGLLSGAALTEYVFQYPGLGRLILEAVLKSDINLVMASLMMGAVMLIVGNLIADILLIITDPRIRQGGQA